jgi:MYXO-CTERM domain-containing protein
MPLRDVTARFPPSAPRVIASPPLATPFMRNTTLRFASLAALTAALHAPLADAVVVSRVTRHGYIISSDTELWGATIPVDNTAATVRFIRAVTEVLSLQEGFHEGQYLAAMQIPVSNSPLAFYLPIRNDVRGIGQRSVIDGRSEVFDLNGTFGSSFPLDGFVYLNSFRYYTDPRAVEFGRYLICTQEFGHRFSANFRAAATTTDAGVADGGVAPLAADAYLGRGNQLPTGMVVNRSHWSYFFNSGGSPMEGNRWTETSPGVFRASMPTFRFSPIDLYAMGLIPAAEVTPTFLIADPQGAPGSITRDSPPEYSGRAVTVRGRRVDVTLNDLVRANGPRNPAYDESASHDLDVVWVLLANPSQINDQLARDFDSAIESCSQGYAFATNERGHLVTTVAGSDGGATDDAAVADAATPEDAAAPEDVASDAASDVVSDGPRAAATPAAGCGCHTVNAHTSGAGLVVAMGALAALGARRRRRG